MKNYLLRVIPLPQCLTLETLAKWRDGERFHFRLRLASSRTGQAMETDYFGGCLAFLHLPPLTEEPATERERDELKQRRTAKDKQLTLARNWVQSRKVSPPAGLYGYDSGTAIDAAFALSIPDLHGVLYSLLSDADCGAETFPDFCANLGYDEDSRKALETYLACQKIGTGLRRVLGPDYSACQSALANY